MTVFALLAVQGVTMWFLTRSGLSLYSHRLRRTRVRECSLLVVTVRFISDSSKMVQLVYCVQRVVL